MKIQLLYLLSGFVFARYHEHVWRVWLASCNRFSGWVNGLPLIQWAHMWAAYFAITNLNNKGFVEFRRFEGKQYIHLRVRAWETPNDGQ